MPVLSLRGAVTWAAALFALLLVGCATPLEPVALRTTDAADATLEWTPLKTGVLNGDRQDGFYPLRIGNRWLHGRELVVTVIPDGALPETTYRYEGKAQREIVSAERLFRGWYLVERQQEVSSFEPWPTWTWYRQDRSGLYEADLSVAFPAASAGPGLPGGAERPLPARLLSAPDALPVTGSAAEQAAYREAWARVRERVATLRDLFSYDWRRAPSPELTRLRYPLRPGATWMIRADPGFRFWATVEEREELDLPPGRFSAFRIRIQAQAFGPDDTVHTWYGSAGFLGLTAHFESDAVDEGGNVYGRVVADQREWLEDLWVPGYGSDGPRKGAVAAR